MVISWAYSLEFWIITEGAARAFLYGIVDLCLTVIFFRMARDKWFPAPLFFLHAALVWYHLSTALIGPNPFWVTMFLNRTFELAMAYIIACSVYRIRARARRSPSLNRS